MNTNETTVYGKSIIDRGLPVVELLFPFHSGNCFVSQDQMFSLNIEKKTCIIRNVKLFNSPSFTTALQ